MARTLDWNLRVVSYRWTLTLPLSHPPEHTRPSLHSSVPPAFYTQLQKCCHAPIFNKDPKPSLAALPPPPHLNTSLPAAQLFRGVGSSTHITFSKFLLKFRKWSLISWMTSSLVTTRFFVLMLLNGFLDETEVSAPPPPFLTHLLAPRINQFLDFLYIPGRDPQVLLSLESPWRGS